MMPSECIDWGDNAGWGGRGLFVFLWGLLPAGAGGSSDEFGL